MNADVGCSGAPNGAAEDQPVFVRDELEHRRRGFRLLSELVTMMHAAEDQEEAFSTAAQHINAALGMQRTLVLVPNGAGGYRPWVAQGYSAGEAATLKEGRFTLPRRLAGLEGPLPVTPQEEDPELAALCRKLHLPYAIVVPAAIQQELYAVLVSGRAAGQTPPEAWREAVDAETLWAIGGLMASVLARQRLDEAGEHARQEAVRVKEEAEANARARSNFLSTMSHEMRTPMNAIIGMTQIAKGTNDPERIRYCLDKVHDASDHLLGLINDILDISKIDAGKFTLSPSEFSIEELVHRLDNVIFYQVEEKQQDFTIEVDPNMPQVIVADKQRLAQVITNLLSNAVKFTPVRGRVSLRMRQEKEEDGLCTLQVEVADTGIGMTPEQQERMFGSFEQADTSIASRFGGTGLGLSISKAIVEMMDGSIWVESAPQQGSRFHFTVKVQKAPGRGADAALAEELKDARILVVDDSPVVLKYMQGVVAPYGVYCETALDAEKAGKILLKKEKWDLIFVDWHMPGIDGIDFIRDIRREFGDEPLIVMISASGWGQIEDQAARAGANLFLEKPLAPTTIIDTITEAVGSGAAWAQRAPASQLISEPYLTGKHLLLVEDLEINREIMVTLLGDTGIEIDTAENGRVACEMFRNGPERYDAIFMDVNMPEMDGLQATREIRAMGLPRSKTVPVVAMTASVFREDVERCMRAGMNDHIGKPISIDEVLNKLDKYI